MLFYRYHSVPLNLSCAKLGKITKIQRSIMTIQITRLYFLLSLSFIIATFFTPYPLSWLVKVLPLALLIFASYKQVQSTNDRIFVLGLVFSACGDFFLDYDRINWFIFGLGSFLFAHICYLFSLKPFAKKQLGIVVVYIVYGVAMLSLLTPNLGELLLPVLVYMTVLLCMGIATLTSEKSNKWLIFGGLSFVVSDSLLGVNKFTFAIPYASFSIMVTYYFAQYALVKGMFLKNKDA